MNILILEGWFCWTTLQNIFLRKGEFVNIVDNIAPLSGGVHPKKVENI